jgi:hypothetical protein
LTVGNPISNCQVSDVCDRGIRIVNLFCNWVLFFNPTYRWLIKQIFQSKSESKDSGEGNGRAMENKINSSPLAKLTHLIKEEKMLRK